MLVCNISALPLLISNWCVCLIMTAALPTAISVFLPLWTVQYYL
jgi:hypothetical protein